VLIRSFQSGDDAAVAGLVAAGYEGDPGLGEMVRGLYGPDREPPAWRRCLVAESPGGAVLGVAAAQASQHHPGSVPVGVLVGPASRRRGVGSALLVAVREAIEGFVPPPLWSTVDSRDPAGVGFAAARGFRPLLRYGVWRLDPATVRLPLAESPVPLTPLTALDSDAVLDALAALLAWGQETAPGWKPTPREVIRAEMLPRLLPAGGVVAVEGGAPVGVAALAEFGGHLTALCDVHNGQAGAEPLLAALLARLLAAAGELGRPVDVEAVLGTPLGTVLDALPTEPVSLRDAVQAEV
jgi:GNAT superfamily N-acetyltransferase